MLHRFHLPIFATVLVWSAAAAFPASAGAGLRQEKPAARIQIDARGLDAFEEGQKAHQLGRLAEAIAAYDRAIALDPELWGAHLQRGVALLQLGQAAAAETSLRRAVEIESEFAAAHAALADALLALDRPNEALAEYRRALAIDPDLSQARPNYAVALWRTGDMAGADRELAMIESARLATADTFTLHAEVLLKLKREPEAEVAFERALALDATHADARAGRGRMRAAAGDLEGAIADLTVANTTRPSPELTADLASLAARANDPERALRLLQERVTSTPTCIPCRRDLADMLVRLGRNDEAGIQADAIVALAPNDAVTHESAGDIFFEKDPLAAARHYVWAVRLAPENVEFRVKLGATLVRAGRYAEAIEHLTVVVARQPDRREGHAGLAAAWYGTDRYADAAREFAWLAEREPAAPFIQFYLAASLDRTGDCTAALAAFERFLALADPTSDRVRIDEVNLRLPGLKRQIEKGCGRKHA